MAAVVPVYVAPEYTAGPNQPIPVYVVNSNGGGNDFYSKTESDAKYTTKTSFYDYAGGDETHPPASAAATYTPTTAFYNYTGGNAGAPPPSAPSTYLKISEASSTYATLVQTQALANDLITEIANSEDIANKTQTVTGSATEYPSGAAVSTALAGKVNTIDGSATRLTVTGGINDYAIATKPANTSEYPIWSLRNSANSQIAAITQRDNVVRLDNFTAGMMKFTNYGYNISESIIFTPTNLTGEVNTIRFNDTSGVLKGRIGQRPGGGVMFTGQVMDMTGYANNAITTQPAVTTDHVLWSLRNSANTQVATISQVGDVPYLTGFATRKLKVQGYPANGSEGIAFTPSSAVDAKNMVFYTAAGVERGAIVTNASGNVQFEGSAFKIVGENLINSFATTLSTSTSEVPRCSAVSAALASYVPTANVEQAVTTSTTNIPSSNAVKTYVDNKVVSTTAMSFTVPTDINIGTVVYYSEIPASTFELKYAFRFDLGSYPLNKNYQMITLISTLVHWVHLSMEVEYIAENRADSADITFGRRMYYFTKPAGVNTGTIITDTNAYYYENKALPYVYPETNSTVPGENHFKLWVKNGDTKWGFISIKVTWHFNRIDQ